jgi:hypothetical protein
MTLLSGVLNDERDREPDEKRDLILDEPDELLAA